MADSDGQINDRAAEIYEEYFVPALFEAWTSRVLDAAEIHPGQRVLDVACGTGILARSAAVRTGEKGSVVGLDRNSGMLAVAARKAPTIEWRQGRAEKLPFEDSHFHAVVSQFGLMFFEDRLAAIREMFRVLRPGGHLAVAVWDSLECAPGYAAMASLLDRLFGERAATALRAPFNLGDTDELRSLFQEADIPDVRIETLAGTAHFPSIESWVYTNIKGWVLADMLDDRQFAELLKEAQQHLSPFVTADGKVVFSIHAHIVSATKPRKSPPEGNS